jgi:hypothetical protein
MNRGSSGLQGGLAWDLGQVLNGPQGKGILRFKFWKVWLNIGSAIKHFFFAIKTGVVWFVCSGSKSVKFLRFALVPLPMRSFPQILLLVQAQVFLGVLLFVFGVQNFVLA